MIFPCFSNRGEGLPTASTERCCESLVWLFMVSSTSTYRSVKSRMVRWPVGKMQMWRQSPSPCFKEVSVHSLLRSLWEWMEYSADYHTYLVYFFCPLSPWLNMAWTRARETDFQMPLATTDSYFLLDSPIVFRESASKVDNFFVRPSL